MPTADISFCVVGFDQRPAKSRYTERRAAQPRSTSLDTDIHARPRVGSRPCANVICHVTYRARDIGTLPFPLLVLDAGLSTSDAFDRRRSTRTTTL